MSDRPYTAKQVCRAAQIAPTTLRTWRSRGLDVGHKKAEQDWTRFSLGDALKIAVVAELGERGVDLPTAAQVVEQLEEIESAADLLPPLFLTAWVYPLEGDEPDQPAPKSERESLPSLATKKPPPDNDWPGPGNWRRVYLSDLVKKWTVNIASDAPEQTIFLAVDIAKIFKRVEPLLRGD